MAEKTTAPTSKYRLNHRHYRNGVTYEPGDVLEIPNTERPGRTWTLVEGSGYAGPTTKGDNANVVRLPSKEAYVRAGYKSDAYGSFLAQQVDRALKAGKTVEISADAVPEPEPVGRIVKGDEGPAQPASEPVSVKDGEQTTAAKAKRPNDKDVA